MGGINGPTAIAFVAPRVDGGIELPPGLRQFAY
jgi:hypothetical protein